MSDLIDRQAAIDALERAKQNIRHNIERAIGRAICEILDEIENGIKQLPPANCSEFPNNSDTISRQSAIDALHMHLMYRMGTDSNKKRLDDWINNLPSAQPEPHEIGYNDCANALLKMWMDNVLTDGEYYRIADKLNEKWGKTELPEPFKEVTE